MRAVLLWAVGLALCGSAAAEIPYTTDGVKCLPMADIKSFTGLSDSEMDSCKAACDRTYNTIEAQKSKGCEQTAKSVYTLMRTVDKSIVLSRAEMDTILKDILNPDNCLHDLELHLVNREKFCTQPGRPDDTPALQAQTAASALRRFALTFSHYHLIKEKQTAGEDFCFPAMIEGLTNPAAALFVAGGPCKDIYGQKWKKGDCSAACWQSVKDAVAATKTAPCCLPKYVSKLHDYTYGNGVPLSGTDWPFSIGDGCSTSSAPCTTVVDAIDICIQDNPNDKSAYLYLPEYCNSSSSLAASALLTLAALLVSAVFSRN